MDSLERDGATIAYEIHGAPSTRLPLLLTHGFGASSAMWVPNLPALAEDRQVITWDVRGHGGSTASDEPGRYTQAASVDDMAAVLDAVGAPQAAVGGLSLGGYLSLAFHLAHPDRVGALLLFDTGPGYRDDEGRERWNQWARSQAERLERHGLAALEDSPERRRGAHDPNGLALAARGILTQRTSAVIDSLPTIAVPTLVLVGSDDRPFLAAADYMARRIPGATRRVIEGAGHASNIDRPDEFDAAVLSFLDGLERL
jgi:pimeloyl-ACP methyl ester carboxylesterase